MAKHFPEDPYQFPDEDSYRVKTTTKKAMETVLAHFFSRTGPCFSVHTQAYKQSEVKLTLARD